jgi:hypothetical protein
VDDLWIGASGDDSGGEDVGSVFLLLGPVSGGTSFVDSYGPELKGVDYDASDVGTILAAGDFDGDGISDVAIGDPYENSSGYMSGAVFLVAGPVSGDQSLSLADARILSTGDGDALGTSVSSQGDIDGDGRDDIGVGAPHADTTGQAYVLLGANEVHYLAGTARTLATETYVSGGADVRGVGSAIAIGGDLDADGSPDVLVGANATGGLAQGAAFVTRHTAGTVALDTGSAAVALRVDGETANDGLGSQVGFTGSVATTVNDGLIVSSSSLNASASAAGGSYIVWAIDL